MIITGEIGINHNGNLEIAKKLIKSAKEAGCDAVKFQKRDIDNVYTSEFLNSHRESPWGNTQRDQKKGLEFNYDEYLEIDEYCKKIGIDWYASAWDLDSQKFLSQFDCKYNKIASAMIVYDKILEMVAKEKKHTFISTGMCEHKDIEKAVKIFRNHECSFELLHTVSTYPMKPEEANLNLIPKLKDLYKCNVGYSGHETGLAISYAAVALGASSLERHITLDRSMYGSDQSASIEISDLRSLVRAVRTICDALGNGEKKILESEIPIANKLREHLNL